MQKIKSFIIYIILAVLCISAFAGYFITKNSKNGNGNQTLENEANLPKHVAELIKKAAIKPDPNPVIGIGRGQDYGKVIADAVENAGGLKDIIKSGNVVLIKPNICNLAGGVDNPTIVDYRATQKVVDMVLELGASKVIIAEGPVFGNPFTGSAVKFNKYDTIKGAQLVNINDITKEECYELKPIKSSTGKAIFIPKIYMDADVVINLAKLKTHTLTEASATLSLKNLFGVPSQLVYGQNGNKYGLHKLGIKEAIVDINRIRRPEFIIIEGIVGGQGFGPMDNQPVKSNIVFAGKDPVAIDTVALTFMGMKIEDVIHIKYASDQKLGISDLKKIKVVCADLNSIKMKFDVIK